MNQMCSSFAVIFHCVIFESVVVLSITSLLRDRIICLFTYYDILIVTKYTTYVRARCCAMHVDQIMNGILIIYFLRSEYKLSQVTIALLAVFRL